MPWIFERDAAYSRFWHHRKQQGRDGRACASASVCQCNQCTSPRANWENQKLQLQLTSPAQIADIDQWGRCAEFIFCQQPIKPIFFCILLFRWLLQHNGYTLYAHSGQQTGGSLSRATAEVVSLWYRPTTGETLKTNQLWLGEDSQRVGQQITDATLKYTRC